MLALVIFGGQGNKIEPAPDAPEPTFYERIAHAGKDGLGAHLDAPADMDTPGYDARPEWYFLFLYQLLKYFEGPLLLIGTVVVPFGVMGLLFLLPLFGAGRLRKFGHFFGVLVVVALIAAVGALTYLAVEEDRNDEKFQGKLESQDALARRAAQIGGQIPEEGAKYLLRRDPLTRGPDLFKQNCAV